MKPTLVILAAGMGSRYGGLKQLDQLGTGGETILEYSIYDAIRAGFGKVVFIIRPDFEEDFRKQIGDVVARHIEVGYVFQTIDKLPEGFEAPEGRTKPWGTGHALLVAQPEVSTPFAILNADDYYGKEAFGVMAEFLAGLTPTDDKYALVGYQLSKTLSDHGTVSRGICQTDERGYLIEVVERTSIARKDGRIYYEEDGQRHPLKENDLASMNFWGFTPRIFDQGNEFFREFLTKRGAEPKSEFYIPSMVTRALEEKKATLQVLSSDSQWFGVTYREDKESAVEKFIELNAQGIYPSHLWG
ncbi:MAG: NTP transferase domain-containing protein [Bacteroidia bacterium]|nr:NTP transferase domain-containing protein [Bacteroidia bacterium]